MFANLLILAVSFQLGPFVEGRPAYGAVRPLWAHEAETTDVLWPVFTTHRDWWRFCFLAHGQGQIDGGYQFEVLPFWFSGRAPDRTTGEMSSYWGLFPIWGRHPHFLLMDDWRFCLWPLWMQYRRPLLKRTLTSRAVLWPFVTWRDDGSWGVWPLYGVNHHRESDHRYLLWPLVTWADYRADRDTSGEGSSWMLWPLLGRVDRERESQWLALPPFFSWTTLRDPVLSARGRSAPGWRLRAPWPFFERESTASRDRLSIWPFYERSANRRYADGAVESEIRRFGWKLVELYPDETRVFPFWVRRADDAYFRLWPFWESETASDGTVRSRCLSLFPIRWVPAVDRNWAKFWTFYESERDPISTRHALFWGLVRWETFAGAPQVGKGR